MPDMLAVVAWIHQKAQWHRKDIRHLGRIRMPCPYPGQKRHHRQNPIPGMGHVRAQCAQHLDALSLKPDLLASLAQRCIHSISVLCIDFSTGERNLSGMCTQLSGTLGQQHFQPCRPVRGGSRFLPPLQSNQHGCISLP